MKKLSIIILVLCSCCSLQQVNAQMVTERIFLQKSDFKFDENMLDQSVQTQKGSMYSERVVDDDVKRLAARGTFTNVSASVRKLADGNVAVTFELTAKPVVSEVRFEGNQVIPTDKLRQELRFTIHAPLNDAQVVATADTFRRMYAEAGRDATLVHTDIRNLSDGSVAIVFKFEEELRIRINDVKFEGNTVIDAADLCDKLETRYFALSADWLSWLPIQGKPGLFDKEMIERDKLRIYELFYRKGYLDFKITDVLTSPVDGNPELVDVLFKVEEGEPYYVGSIKVTGASAFPEEKIRECIKLTPDNAFNVQTEENDLRRIEALYSPEGYADFRARVIRNANFTNHTVDLEYRINEGPQYTIGEITINGNKYTKPHVILRELPVKPNDKADKQQLEISRSILLGMGYFESARARSEYTGDRQHGPKDGVDITMVNSAEPNKKDIHIEVNERRFITANIGGTWSDSDGLAGVIDLQHINADVTDWNWNNRFTGGGQRIRVQSMIGIDRKNVVADFTEPWLFGMPLRWNISGYWKEYTFEDWDEMRLGFTTSLEKRLFDDFTTVQLGYTFEQVRITDMEHKLSRIFQEHKTRDLVSKIFFKLERDTRDSYTDPKSGYNIAFNTFYASTLDCDSADYYRFELQGMGHYSFFQDWFTISAGFRIGVMDGIGEDKFVPLYDRYFLGGGDSLRGFPYRSVGPTDWRDDNYGGEFMYLATVELSHPIYKDYLRGAVFCDIGNATAKAGKFGAPNVGLGYGLRIKLPHIPMPIRLDLAYPVVNNQDGVKSRLRFHFNIGVALF